MLRYGDQYGRRRRRRLLVSGAVVAVGGVLAAGYTWSAGVGFLGWQIGKGILDVARDGRSDATVARLPRDGRAPARVRRKHLVASERVVHEGAPALHVAHDGGKTLFTGDDARAAAARLFPAVNRFGGTPHDVRTAVARIEHAGDAARYFGSLADTLSRTSAVRARLG